jgi:hypothetical protein
MLNASDSGLRNLCCWVQRESVKLAWNLLVALMVDSVFKIYMLILYNSLCANF